MTDRPDPHEYLASGQAWMDFCEALKGAGADLLRETAPKSPLDLAEGHRYLTRMLRSAFELIMEGANPEAPELAVSLSETIKIGWDNPDNLHLNARLYGHHSYRVWGTRGDAHYLSFGVYGGSYAQSGGRRTVAYVPAEELEIEPDGSFQVILSPDEHTGNWIKLDPDTTTLMIRQTFWDKQRETPADLRIELLDRRGPPAPLDPAFVTGALHRAARYLRGTNRLFFDLSDQWATRPNTWWPSDLAKAEQTQGIRGMSYCSGWWTCRPDQALVMDVVPPPCRYWSLVLSNYWGESLEYRYRPVHVNRRGAVHRADGSLRFVIAHRDPGLPDANWLDTESHEAGVMTLRWLEPEVPDPPLPACRLVAFDALAGLA